LRLVRSDAPSPERGSVEQLKEDTYTRTVAWVEHVISLLGFNSEPVTGRSRFDEDSKYAEPRTQRQDQGPVNRGGVSVIGAVDVYVSDFTVIDVVPNRFQRERDFWILDSEYWEIAYLDGYKTEKISKIGDAERRHILVDWMVKSNNEAASAVFADVDETTAMVA